MLHLKNIRKWMKIKGIIDNDIVEVIELRKQSANRLLVTCRDSKAKTHKFILNSAYESQMECMNRSMLPWSLLPQTPDEKDSIPLTKAERLSLNNLLAQAGFKLLSDKKNGYDDWSYEGTTYRVVKTGFLGQSFITQLEKAGTTPSLEDGSRQKISTRLISKSKAATGNAASTSDLSSITPLQSNQHTLLPGMIVRIPFDIGEQAGEYRDYHIGQLIEINAISNIALIKLQMYVLGRSVAKEVVEERHITQIHRCHILPNTPFIHTETQQQGEILLACEPTWRNGIFSEYYIQMEGNIQRLSENQITVASHRQAPDPLNQLRRYELHHPRWKFRRDQLIESYAQLHTATYGLEDLVGSRIRLLPHQAEVIATVLSNETCRYILADEVGLGKTIEACVILKGLSRRFSNLKTLVIAPASLIEQWHFELNSKFWLDFVKGNQLTKLSLSNERPGMIISSEQLSNNGELALWLSMQKWGLLIVDEAHHLYKHDPLYRRIYQLSSTAERTLILSATPIQRRANEYLALLRLMHPERYSALNRTQFDRLIESQQVLRQTITYLAQALTPGEFDLDEFIEEMEIITEILSEDEILPQLVREVAAQASSKDQLKKARETISYISENYRIESRVIRNRRVNLNIELPTRVVNTQFSYLPQNAEVELLNELYDYIDFLILEAKDEVEIGLCAEYGRILLHRAFSSPHSLESSLEKRQQLLEVPPKSLGNPSVTSLLAPASPREEAKRIKELLEKTPSMLGEKSRLKNLLWLCQNWRIQTNRRLDSLTFGNTIPNTGHRLIQVLRAIQTQLQTNPASKIVIFSTWVETLLALLPHLQKHIGSLKTQIAEFHCQVPNEKLQEQANLFQSQENYSILLCDELGGEGRNFQIADAIIHIDIPWTPAQLEQRIGRVDRLGRTGEVLSIVPFAQEQVEHDLFRIWEEGFSLFTHSMSGLEIALESVLDEFLTALKNNVRDGLMNLLPEMQVRAENIREEVEEERYFEENAINHRRRDEFRRLSQQYRDGSKLGRAFTSWASMAGLDNHFNPQKKTVTFFPKRFNFKSMANAKFVMPPNMEEALTRSGRTHNLVISGTFDRDIAVQREDLVFFAPGNDPWTDAIVDNALEADRGRSCAILRKNDQLSEPWQGIELFYQIQVNPKPLYEAGHAPIHLYQAQGYLYTPTYRLLISVDGDIIPRSHQVWQAVTAHPFSKTQGDIHLGKRGNPRKLDLITENYPPDVWENIVKRVKEAANSKIQEEFEFTVEVAQEAEEALERKLVGLRAAQHWFEKSYDGEFNAADFKAHQQIATALVEGIRHPLIQLESACFWWICPTQDYESLLSNTTRTITV